MSHQNYTNTNPSTSLPHPSFGMKPHHQPTALSGAPNSDHVHGVSQDEQTIPNVDALFDFDNFDGSYNNASFDINFDQLPQQNPAPQVQVCINLQVVQLFH